jgi:hypothetical protein
MIGWRKLPSISWTAMTSARATSAISQPSSAKATRTATRPETNAPTKGTNAPEEDEDPKRKRKRYAEQPQADADQDRVDRRDQRRSLHEAAQHGPRAAAGPVDDGAILRREAAENPAPELGAVAEHEVEEGDREHQARDEAEPGLDALGARQEPPRPAGGPLDAHRHGRNPHWS